MRIYRLPAFEKELDKLGRTQRAADSGVTQLERTILKGKAKFSRMRNLGCMNGSEHAEILKSYVALPGVPPRDGLRYVAERLVLDGVEIFVALTVYYKKTDYDENKNNKRIKDRFYLYEPTPAGFAELILIDYPEDSF